MLPDAFPAAAGASGTGRALGLFCSTLQPLGFVLNVLGSVQGGGKQAGLARRTAPKGLPGCARPGAIRSRGAQ